MNTDRSNYLLTRYFEGTASAEEVKEMMNGFTGSAASETQQASLIETFTDGLDLSVYETNPEPAAWQRIWAYVQQTLRPATVVLRRWLYMAVAVLLFLVAGTVYLYRNTDATHTETAGSAPKAAILPGAAKATLTLADGRVVTLDSKQQGELAKEGGATIQFNKGEIAYTNNQSIQTGANPMMNTLTTPNGGEYKLVLPDGSKVWLNAASSLRYAARFTGKTKTREVALEGEAYFEIAPNASMPFYVTVNQMKVEVLGTHFNINNYKDEPYAVTTLEEGAVRVHVGNKVQTLLPGQQSLSNEAGVLSVRPADLATVLAWKNGRMYFNDADIPTIMRQVARWYNIKVKYTGAVTADPFTGGISRSANLEVLLNILKTSGIRFRVEEDPGGKTLVVTP
jgi:ferric-dicitrate binding protein FerR (iron transport regulator)